MQAIYRRLEVRHDSTVRRVDRAYYIIVPMYDALTTFPIGLALMMKRTMMNHKVVFDKKRQEDKIWSDPDNEENQRLIAERIRMENVQANMEVALEELPEGFGRVIMLYVDVEINGHPVKAFVDSGAQSTIMSAMCAERCGLTRLLDKRFSGEARGVGTAKILGRVHIVQMKFGESFFPVSITILDQNDVDFLFGLDMLKRHKCEIRYAKHSPASEA